MNEHGRVAVNGIGRAHHVIYDCPDPPALAAFYSQLLSLPVTHSSVDFAVVATNDTTSGFAFALVADHVRPRWPDPAYPQQLHLDVMVDGLAEGDAAARALGATLLSAADHVYADPAGHPFCLITRPGWAPPIHPDVTSDPA